jgi:hypothetical protein
VFVASAALVATAATPGVAAASQTDWSAPLNVDASNELTSVSCASPEVCMAVDETGNVLTYNGSSWSPSTNISEAGFLSVSCPTTTFCITVDEVGAYDNGTAAVAVPSVAVASTTAKLSDGVPAKVSLELPKKVPVAGPIDPAIAGGGVKGPPVSVTLQALDGSQDPTLCPPDSGSCEGDIV